MPEVNFNLLNPSAELYSGPQVALDPVKAYETAQAKQQSNMLAQLYAKHYDPQTGGVNYNSLIGEAAQNRLTAEKIPEIMVDAQKQAQSQAVVEHNRRLAEQEEAAAKKYKVETENLYDEQRHKEVNRAVADISKYANKPDAMSGIEKSFEEGKIDQQAYDNLMNMVRSEPSWTKSQRKILLSLLDEKEQYEAMKPAEPQSTIGKMQADYDAAVKAGDTVAAKSLLNAIQVESGEKMTAEQRARIDNERARIEKAEDDAGKAATANEQMSSYNINRIVNSLDAVSTAVTEEPGAQKPGVLETVTKGTPYLSGLTGFTQSEKRQIVDSAQYDMIDALLYLSTGAAYSKGQFDAQIKSYLPILSDKPGNIESKRNRLKQLVLDAKSRLQKTGEYSSWTPAMEDKLKRVVENFGKTDGKGTSATSSPAGAGDLTPEEQAELARLRKQTAK